LKNIPKTRRSGNSADRNAQNPRQEKTGNARLSNRLLHDLRNKIPIRGLLENELDVRHQTESGIFRFECPLCGSFHTSVMKTKNLARCFECEINFNPIDMVIAVKKTDFRKSADFLANLLESGVSENPVGLVARDASKLVSLSSVLCSLTEPPPDEGDADHRIQSLEKEVGELKNRMDRLQRLVVGIVSKRGDFREQFGKIG
jgi:hypothetical protein